MIDIGFFHNSPEQTFAAAVLGVGKFREALRHQAAQIGRQLRDAAWQDRLLRARRSEHDGHTRSGCGSAQREQPELATMHCYLLQYASAPSHKVLGAAAPR